MPKAPEGLRPSWLRCRHGAVERLGELLDNDDERVRLEAAKAILETGL
jgi:hypothetical protein